MIKKILFVCLSIISILLFQSNCNSAESGTEVDNLIADYNSNTSLAPVLLKTADAYAWSRSYGDAERLCRAVNDKQPTDNWGAKARLVLARINTLELIGQKEYDEAYQKIGSLKVEFKDEPDLEEALFQVGQELFWYRQFGEARELFDKAKEMFPNGIRAREMKLWSAKTACCVLIYSRRATDAEIITAIDKMINDFQSDAGLPWAVYWLSKEYEWTKGTSLGRAAWYDNPNSVYQKIMQKFSDTPFGQQAELDQKRLNHRMKIFNLMKESDQNAIDTAIEEMVSDLAGNPEVAGELYWIACGYEERPDKEQKSKQIYERIVKQYPGTDEATKATLDLRRRIITDLINEGDVNGSEVLIDKFIIDFKEHPNAGSCLGRIAIGYYKKGYELKTAGQIDKAIQHFEQSEKTFERIQTNNLTVVTDAPYLYFYAGANYFELKKQEKAIESLQIVADKWPEFEHACLALVAIGGSYEFMRDKEGVPKEAVDPLIEQAYTKILSNYPDCYGMREAAYGLAQISEEKGDKTLAAEYYRVFLNSKARCGDNREPAVRAKLAELEGTN